MLRHYRRGFGVAPFVRDAFARHENTKQRIVKQKGYLDLELNHEDAAEFDYKPGKCKRAYKVAALRKNISRSKGEQALLDEIRYFFYITTHIDLPAEQNVALANERCDQENVIGDLKSGIGAFRCTCPQSSAPAVPLAYLPTGRALPHRAGSDRFGRHAGGRRSPRPRPWTHRALAYRAS